MRASRPTARPALALIQLLNCAANPALAGARLLRVADPADELVARQHRDVQPDSFGGLVVHESRGEVSGQVVDLASWQSRLCGHVAWL